MPFIDLYTNEAFGININISLLTSFRDFGTQLL